MALEYRKATSGLRALPDFLIAGAQKCGTSSIHRHLSEHPALLSASIKEVHFFNGGLDPIWDKHAEGASLYKSYFPLRQTVRKHNALCFEASPDYFFNPLAPARIAKMLPQVKLVFLLRDPVERAISHYFHERSRGRETASIEDAFALEDARLAPALESRSYKDTRFINQSYKLRGHYAQQLERCFEHFPREQILVREAERFFEAPSEVMNEVLDFVGVEKVSNSTTLPPVNVGKNKEPVPDALRNSLKAHFEPSNRKLVGLLGQPFRWA